MEKKLLFLDIDGTIFDNELDMVHPSTLEALKMLKEKEDILVFIATGRSMQQASEVLDHIPPYFDGYVLINGQLVFLNGEIIFNQPLPQSFVQAFISECNRLNVPYGLVNNSFSVVSSHHPIVTASFDNFKMDLPPLVKEEDLNQLFYQGLFFDMRYFGHFREYFKNDARFMAWSKNDGADIVAKGCSKAKGIEAVCKYLDITIENTYAIGDSTNDIEMIQFVGTGIAMGNAKDELLEVADYVTDRIENDGLYNALKHFNLI